MALAYLISVLRYGILPVFSRQTIGPYYCVPALNGHCSIGQESHKIG